MESLPPKEISEGAVLGEGAYGCVSAQMKYGKLRAQKEGALGTLEVKIAKLWKGMGSKQRVDCLVKYIGSSTTRHALLTNIAPKPLEIEPSEALKVGTFLCKAVVDVSTAYHKTDPTVPSIVHRDIKPSNIRISPKGKYKLIDWGSAAPAEVPQKGSYKREGTPGYVAPEAYDDSKITEKFDSWAIGMTMYNLLSGGELPFTGTNIEVSTMLLLAKPASQAEFMKALDALPRAEGVPEAVYTVMKGLLAVDPEARLSPAEALAQLEAIETSTPESISSPSPTDRAGLRPMGDSPGIDFETTAEKIAEMRYLG